MRKKAFIGLFLLLFGAALFLFSLVKVTRVDTAINTSFVVKQGEKYGPYDTGTYHHTRILVSKSVLRGEVSVEGEGIYFTAKGYNTNELKNVFIDHQHNFTIDHANDQYTFIFDNTNGNADSLVNFSLEEKWTARLALQSPIVFILSLVGIFVLSPIGLILFILSYYKPDAKRY